MCSLTVIAYLSISLTDVYSGGDTSSLIHERSITPFRGDAHFCECIINLFNFIGPHLFMMWSILNMSVNSQLTSLFYLFYLILLDHIIHDVVYLSMSFNSNYDIILTLCVLFLMAPSRLKGTVS